MVWKLLIWCSFKEADYSKRDNSKVLGLFFFLLSVLRINEYRAAITHNDSQV